MNNDKKDTKKNKKLNKRGINRLQVCFFLLIFTLQG